MKQLEAWQDNTPKKIKEILDWLQTTGEALGRLHTDLSIHQGQLRAARESLDRLKSFRGTARKVATHAQKLTQWLERTTLVEVAQKQLQVADTLKKAKQNEWQGIGEDAAILVQTHQEEGALSELERYIDTWIKERDQALEQLSEESQPPDNTTDEVTEQPRQDWSLSSEEVTRLDRVGAWLFPTQAQEGKQFGKQLRTALNDGWSIKFGNTLTIGADHWAEPLLEQLDAMQAACLELAKLAPAHLTPYRTIKTLLELTAVVAANRIAVEQTFLQKLTTGISDPKNLEKIKFHHALNELLALFTPARWTYQDISLTTTVKGDHTDMAVAINDNTDINFNLRWNTAELNLFTLALFLLCAVRVENPLHLLILDDPLQNMDERTVMALSRGMAKLLKLYPKNWQLLFLFHGEDNTERFRQETLGAVYHLPPLSIAANTAETRIQNRHQQAGQLAIKMQDAMNIFENSPK